MDKYWLKSYPDGVPHDVVGRTALAAVLLAGVGVFAYFFFGIWIAVAIGAVALWLLLHGVTKRSRRERTEEAVVEAITPHGPAHRVVTDHRGDDNA